MFRVLDTKHHTDLAVALDPAEVGYAVNAHEVLLGACDQSVDVAEIVDRTVIRVSAAQPKRVMKHADARALEPLCIRLRKRFRIARPLPPLPADGQRAEHVEDGGFLHELDRSGGVLLLVEGK